MLPTLRPGQELLVFNWAYLFFQPRVGEMVVIEYNGRKIIKRIQRVHDHKYFVMGDNKTESTDSRNFGPIDESEIVGKVIFVS